jgi:membrane-associated phospholipid phosphatase
MSQTKKSNNNNILNSTSSDYHYKFLYLIPLVYMVVVSIYMLWHRAWLSPDQFFAFAIFATLILGKTRQFFHDWIPALLLFFSYEYLRGIIPILSLKPHIFPLINADKILFGFIPSIKLQSLLFVPCTNHWYDYLASILYISHFIMPMLVAFLFWLNDRQNFKKFITTFLVLSYMAFFTYIIFPAMPPWMASAKGYLPPLQKIMDQVFMSFAQPIHLPSIYKFFGADEVAAIPSLHAAFPWLIFLFAAKKIGLFSFLLLPYVLGVWFSVVYLGEHYVIDVIIGSLYASLAFVSVPFIEKKYLSYQLRKVVNKHE